MLLLNMRCCYVTQIMFFLHYRYYNVKDNTHSTAIFAAAISVFLETNAHSQTNKAPPVLQLRNIPVVDTLSRCDTVVQFS